MKETHEYIDKDASELVVKATMIDGREFNFILKPRWDISYWSGLQFWTARKRLSDNFFKWESYTSTQGVELSIRHILTAEIISETKKVKQFRRVTKKSFGETTVDYEEVPT